MSWCLTHHKETENKMAHRNANRVQKMIKIDPHCYWCGIEVVYIATHLDHPPGNRATVDHLYSRKKKQQRLEAMRIGKKLNNGHNIYYVLACHKCNFERSKTKD